MDYAGHPSGATDNLLATNKEEGMTDKAGKLVEICTKLVETAAVLEITGLDFDTVKSSERVGHWRDGYAFTGYGTVTLKVTFAPPRVKELKREAKRIEAASTIEGQATEA